MVVLTAIGAVLLFLLRLIGVLLLIALILAAILLLCPFCADVCWQDEGLTVKAGMLGIVFPVYYYPERPAQEPKGAWGRLVAKRKAHRKHKKAAKKPTQTTEKKASKQRKKAKITLDIVCTIVKGAGSILRTVFGQLRFTKIDICIGIRGKDPAQAAIAYGKLQAWLYPSLGLLDRAFYLDFDRLQILPDFSTDAPTVKDHVSFRVSARALFIVIALLRVLYEFWRKRVFDVFL